MKLPRIALLVLLLLSCVVHADSAEGFRRALPGYTFAFPRDHGSHPDFKTEWWYFTGNLADAEGRRFGFEYTIFRSALAAPKGGAPTASALAAEQMYLAHFAISDLGGERHGCWEAAGRAGFDLAHASVEGMELRVGEWTMHMAEGERIALHTSVAGAGIDLKLVPAKPLVLHGKDGVHQKAGDAGQASHYYSYTRLDTSGSLRWEGREYQVEGIAWMDHEFGSDQLASDQVGWDWFALQLDSGEELMLYQMRRKDGSYSAQSAGSLIGVQGGAVTLPGESYKISATGSWRSPVSGGVYPMGWKVTIPGQRGELTVTPAFSAQEMTTDRFTGTVYWEGAVTVAGNWKGASASGRGYVELVGYASGIKLP